MDRNTVRTFSAAICFVFVTSCLPDPSSDDTDGTSTAPSPTCETPEPSNAECTLATDCPGDDNACEHRVCDHATCSISIEPPGVKTVDLVIGDCRIAVCDGNGSTDIVLAIDPFDDNNDCTIDSCVDGVGFHDPMPINTSCVLRSDHGVSIGVCTVDGECTASLD